MCVMLKVSLCTEFFFSTALSLGMDTLKAAETFIRENSPFSVWRICFSCLIFQLLSVILSCLFCSWTLSSDGRKSRLLGAPAEEGRPRRHKMPVVPHPFIIRQGITTRMTPVEIWSMSSTIKK